MPIPEPILDEIFAFDRRYRRGGYHFVEEALEYAQQELGLHRDPENPEASHLTGQQLCEAIRHHAQEEFGYMAKVVLNSWGIRTTSDIGEIVYNMIKVKCMNKSEHDRREDFDDCFDFEVAFQQDFRIVETE